MEILNSTNAYIEELGQKVSVQKKEVRRIRRGHVGKKGAARPVDDEADSEASEDEQEREPGVADEADETERVKYKLKNSSSVYYKITHSISDEVTEQPKMLSGGTMKAYQLYGLNWMVSLYNNNLNGILADEMGLGKTIQTIALFAYLIEVKKNFGPFLVVVPLTTITNWAMEFEKWAPETKVIIYKGKKSAREEKAREIKLEKFNVLITTYEYIMLDRAALRNITWQYIVVDEGHRMKNQKSKFALTLGTQYNSAHRILLTGTPLQNNLSELWALLNFLLPKIFSSCEDFQKWFDKALNKSYSGATTKVLGDDKAEAEREAAELSEEEQLLIINRLHQILRPFLLRRVKKDVAKDLPQKIEMVIKVELSATQRAVYKGIQENNQLMIDPSKPGQRPASLKNAIMQLRKICNHPYLFEGHYPGYLNDHIFQVSGKFELLDRMLPKIIGTGHKVLIFSQFTSLLDLLSDYFVHRQIPFLILDGRTETQDREARLARFSTPGAPEKVFVLSTKAGGHGLNLQVADTVIIFDSDWNPQMDEQAKDRAHRIGQESEVRVFRLITATRVEEGILSKATYKKGLDDKIIQAGLYNDQATDVDRQKKLEEILRKDDAAGSASENEEDTEIPSDEQINAMVARSPEEIELFYQMDQEMYAREGKAARMKRIMEERPGLKDYSRINWRLTQDWEVPEWVRVRPVNRDEEDRKVLELGKRKRNQFVNYDNMSDQRFMQIIGEGKDPNEVLRKEAETKRETRQRGAGDAVDAGDGSQYDSKEEDDDYEGPRAKRRKAESPGTIRRRQEEAVAAAMQKAAPDDIIQDQP